MFRKDILRHLVYIWILINFFELKDIVSDSGGRFKKGIWDVDLSKQNNSDVVDTLEAVREALMFIYAKTDEMKKNLSHLTTDNTPSEVSTEDYLELTTTQSSGTGIMQKTIEQWNTEIPEVWKELEEVPDTVGPVTEAVARITENAANFSETDIVFVGLTVENVVTSGVDLDQRTTQNMVDSFGNLMTSDSEVLLESESLNGTTSKLVENIEKFTQQIMIKEGEDSHVFTHPQLAVAVASMDHGNKDGLFFELEESQETPTKEAQEEKKLDKKSSPRDLQGAEIKVSQTKNRPGQNNKVVGVSVQIPSEAFVAAAKQLGPGKGDKVKAHFVVYSSDNFFKSMKASGTNKRTTSDYMTTRSYDQPVADDTQVDKLKFERKINTRVVAVGIPGVKVTGLQQKVVQVFQHSVKMRKVENPTCVFWDNELEDWSDKGMMTNHTDWKKGQTRCESDHLTNFAVLMDVYGTHTEIDVVHKFALSIISYIGCGISMVALFFTLISYAIFSKLRKENPSKILINLCIVLFLVVLTFVVNTILASSIHIIACKVLAGLLHYFLLSTMCWMLVESFYLYLALVKVFQTYYSRFIAKCALFGWGTPLIIVGITVAVSRANYTRQNNICWLDRNAFYGAFAAPVALVLFLNVIAFCVVIRQLRSVAAKKLEKSKNHTISVQIRGAIGITVLLGLTWIFAFLAVGSASLVFSYLFAIFNSFQGLFIFVFYCLLKRDVQRAYMRCLPFCPTPTDDTRTTSKSGKGSGTTSSNLSNQTKRLGPHLNGSPTHQPILVTKTPIPEISMYQSENNANGSYMALEKEKSPDEDNPTKVLPDFTEGNEDSETEYHTAKL